MSFKAGAHEVWRVLTFALVMALAVALVVMGGKTPEAQAETAVIPGVPQTVSADGLPTWQINGVVWQQATVGNTVYVAGRLHQGAPTGRRGRRRGRDRSELHLRVRHQDR